MKKVLVLAVMLIGLNLNIVYGEDHNHAPGHCEWCEENAERGLVDPPSQAELRNEIKMPDESSSLNVVLLLIGFLSVGVALGTRSYLKREKHVENK